MARPGKRLVVVILAALLLIASVGWYVYSKDPEETHMIDSFEACVAAGNPVMESYPERCAAEGKTYTNPAQTLVPPAETK